LMAAARGGSLDIVKALLANGADVNKAANDGVTALYIAAENGHSDVVRALLANGANVNKAANDGATPLYIAAHQGRYNVVELLLIESGMNSVAAVAAAEIAAQQGNEAVAGLLNAWSQGQPDLQEVKIDP